MELWSFNKPVVAVVIAVVMVTVFPVDSELLQALDLCDNDPVAVARCFVLKVRGSARNHQNIQTAFILKEPFEPCFQSCDFRVLTFTIKVVTSCLLSERLL